MKYLILLVFSGAQDRADEIKRLLVTYIDVPGRYIRKDVSDRSAAASMDLGKDARFEIWPLNNVLECRGLKMPVKHVCQVHYCR